VDVDKSSSMYFIKFSYLPASPYRHLETKNIFQGKNLPILRFYQIILNYKLYITYNRLNIAMFSPLEKSMAYLKVIPSSLHGELFLPLHPLFHISISWPTSSILLVVPQWWYFLLHIQLVLAFDFLSL